MKPFNFPTPVRIELPLGLSYPTVNAYLIPGSDPVLIDCGLNTEENLKTVTHILQQNALNISDLSRVIITHPHVDHIGMAGILAKYGVEIWVSDPGWHWMQAFALNRKKMVRLVTGEMARQGFSETQIQSMKVFYAGLSDLYSEIPEEAVKIFTAADRIPVGDFALAVIYAPGHSNRQFCFYEPGSQVLFSADMLLPKTPVPVIEPALDDTGKRSRGIFELMTSYERMLDLEVQVTYPGHGKKIDNHKHLIQTQQDRIQARTQQCLELIQNGTQEIPELLDTLYAYLPPVFRLSGYAMLLGYLDLLEQDQKVRSYSENGVEKYKAI